MTKETESAPVPVVLPEHQSILAEPTIKRVGVMRRFTRSKVGTVSLSLLLLIGAACALAPLITDQDPQLIDLSKTLQGPSGEHLLGTDESGRDVLARLLYGGRISLVVGLAAMSISVVLGTLLGALAGYFGGWLDRFVVQFVDGLLAVPIFFFWLIALASLGSTTVNIILIIGLTAWMPTARVVRAEVVRIRSLDFVEAGNALGATHARLLFRYVLPQATPIIIVSATLATAFAILSESALSYLGVGVQPPLPSWGRMLSVAQNHIWETPWLAVWPGFMVLLTVLLFNLMGDAMQEAMSTRD
jgi:peptide/nickel transport system permease protein